MPIVRVDVDVKLMLEANELRPGAVAAVLSRRLVFTVGLREGPVRMN
jgi:hypothetical protein